MGKVRKSYTREFKMETVRLSYQMDKPLGEFADDMGISRSSLSRWRSELKADPAQSFPGNGNRKERDAEVARLKKQLRQAEMERDILKHIVGYRYNRLAQTPDSKMGATCIPCF